MVTRVLLLLVALAWPAAVSAQACSPSDTLRIVRQGAALWYILVDGDSLRHVPGGPPRGFTSEGVAAAHAVALRALTGRTIMLHQTYRGRILGCIPTSPPQQGDSLAPPPASDSLPTEPPEVTPQDTVAPGVVMPRALGVITCRPESACEFDASASVGDSVSWEGSDGFHLFSGPVWSTPRQGFGSPSNPQEPRVRTWWIVAHSGPRADTAVVVWTVPVTEETVYPATPMGTVIGAALPLRRWVMVDPATGRDVVLFLPWGSPAVDQCSHYWLWRAWSPRLDALYAPGDILWRAWLPGREAQCTGVVS